MLKSMQQIKRFVSIKSIYHKTRTLFPMQKSRLILLIFLLFFSFLLRGQSSPQSANLIVNPSFEIRDSLSPRHTKSVVDTIVEFVGWSSPTFSFGEVYDGDKDGWIEDNTNIRGQRNFKAKTGKRVAKLITYTNYLSRSFYNSNRSYLQNELSEAMVVGQKYYIGFWSHFHCLATNNISMAFSVGKVQSDSAFQLMMQPRARLKVVNNYDAKNIWVLTVDSFIADKPYQFCVIGNFYGNDSTGLGGSKDFNHYLAFVDDVFVSKAKNTVMQPRIEPPIPTKIKKPSPLPKVLNKVQFLYNSAEFEPVSLPQLDSAVVVLKNYPNLEVLIKGHTSSEGDADYNQKLSEKRAFAVKNYLTEKGIDPKRLTAQGFGETQLLMPDDSEDNKRLNRRIEFEVVKE
jgi:outer membrane protein OmpA-like peptidoglycan-associated protein